MLDFAPLPRPEEAGSSSDRLDSWKAIADYLGRDVRTVQRWEKEEGLPVHRLPHKKQGSVFAYRSELDIWYARASSRSEHCDEEESPTSVERSPPLSSRIEERRAPRLRRQFIFVMSSMAAAAILFALGRMSESAIPSAPLRIIFLRPLPSGWSWKSSAGTDGFHVYYTEALSGRAILSDLRLDAGSATQVSLAMAHPRILAVAAANPAASPLVMIDSRFGEAGKLMAFSPADHRVWKLSDETADCAAWAPHGVWLAACSGNRILLLRENETTRTLTTFETKPVAVAWSPDGNSLAVLVQHPISLETVLATAPNLSLWIVEVRSGKATPVGLPRSAAMDCAGSVAWSSRYLIYVSRCQQQSTIWAMPTNRELVSNQSAWVLLNRNLSRVVRVFPMTDPDSLLIDAEESGPAQLVRLSPRDESWHPAELGTNPVDLDYSRDGQWITWVEYPERTLWRARVDGTKRMRLTSPPLRAQLPKWSPDGKSIAFSAMEPGGFWQVYVTTSNGSHMYMVAPDRSSQGGPTWSPDGRYLIFGDIETDDPQQHVIHMVDVATHTFTILPHSAGLRTARWSPDGRYIAAIHYATQTLSLLDTRTGTWSQVAPGVAGDTLNWSPDSRSVFFDCPFEPNSGIYQYDLQTHSVARALAYGPYRRPVGFMPDVSGFSIAPDGSILLTASAQSSRLWLAKLGK